MANLQPVSPGSPLRISAGDYNACLEAARDFKSRRLKAEAESKAIRDPSIVLIRNDTAADLDFMDVLGIDEPLILPTDNINEWRSRVAFSCIEPAATHTGRYAVLQEPIPAGKIGRAMVIGVTPVTLDVTADTDRFAEIVTGVSSSLKTGTSGSARILWKESGTGSKRGVVMLSGETAVAPALRGVLAATLTASASHVIPDGVYRILIIWAAGGGGKATGGPATGIMMFAASTSGGATTYRIDYNASYSGGGDGGMGMAWVDVTPGETLTITVGTAGSGTSYPGGNGGDTTIEFPSSGGTLTATGGIGSYPAAPGDAGYVASSVVSGRNPVVVDLMSNGGIGSDLIFKDSGGVIIGGWASTMKGSKKSVIPNTTYGKGGTSGAGNPGVVVIYH